MTRVVLDTSVIIKWFSPEEEDSNEANLILEAIHSGRVEIVLPYFAQLEIANILRLGKKFSREETKKYLIDFFNLSLVFVEINQQYILEISTISYSTNITSYDAAFVAVANRWNIPLFTADYKHHKKSVSKNIIWLKEWKGKL